MVRILSNIAQALEKLEKTLVIIGSFFLLFMMILGTMDVAGRYFFSAPVPGAMFYMMLFLVCIGWLGIPYAQAKRRHIRVETAVAHLPLRYQAIPTVFGDLAMLAITVLVAWQGWRNAVASWAIKEVELTESFEVSVYMWKFIVPVTAGILCLQLLLDIVREVSRAMNKN